MMGAIQIMYNKNLLELSRTVASLYNEHIVIRNL
jgi:hypothetical protein